MFINLQALIWAQMIKKHDQTNKVNGVKLGSDIFSVDDFVRDGLV